MDLAPEPSAEELIIEKVALQFWALISAMTNTKTPAPTSVHSLKASSPNIPEPVLLFFRTVFKGISNEDESDTNETIERKAVASASDLIYNASHGRTRPWKNVSLGIGISSITGSKVLLQILN